MSRPCVFVKKEGAEAVTDLMWLCLSSLTQYLSFHHQVFIVSIAEIPDKAEICISLPLAAWQGMLTAPDHYSYIPKCLGSSLLCNCVESEVRLRRRYTAQCLECYFRTSETWGKSLNIHPHVQLGDSLGSTFYISLFHWLVTKLLVTIHHCSQNNREASFHP